MWARAIVLLTALLAPGRADAEQPDRDAGQASASERVSESERLALEAFEAYKAGEYETAIELYNRALEAHRAAAIYYNVARIYDTKLSAPDRALEYYKKALKAPDVTEELVEKSIARIRVLSAIRDESEEPEEQAKPQEREPTPAEGAPSEEQREPAEAAPGERPISRPSTQKTIGYAVGITGLIVTGAGLGLGGWALLERNEARETCTGGDCTTQGGVDSMNTAHDLATASTITVSAGGALAVIGLGMILFAPRTQSADRDSAKTQSRSGLELAVQPTFGGAGLQLAGAF